MPVLCHLCSHKASKIYITLVEGGAWRVVAERVVLIDFGVCTHVHLTLF
jgi:hypothetical protein